MSDNPVLIARSHLARTVQHHGRGSPEAIEAKRALLYAKLERCAKETVAAAPDPSPEQVGRIVGLLNAAHS